MININVNPYTISIPQLGYRLAQYKTQFRGVTNEFPISLVHIQSAENSICSAFDLLLEQDASKLIPGNFCLHIHN